MLSYQHHYHVGNHADVLKHWVLFECLKHMQKKDKPFEYIDTHAGAGIYEFSDPKTQKLKEFETGVNLLLAEQVSQVADFCELLKGFTDNAQYPGSPAIVNELLRPGDKSWLFELHPQTFSEITQHCQRKRQTFVRQEDGFKGLNSLLPCASKRALVLVDPSYELKQDYVNVVDAIKNAVKKMPQTMLLLWYPVVRREDVELIETQLQHSEVRNVLQLELSIAADSQEKGMTGSGMIVVNPPWTLLKQAETVLPKLTELLSKGSGSYQLRQLIEE